MLVNLLFVLGVLAWPGHAAAASEAATGPVIDERKDAFFARLLPHIRVVNDEIWQERMVVERLAEALEQDSEQDSEQDVADELLVIGNRYGLPKPPVVDRYYVQALLRRVDVIPAALVLAQAANESGWGASRFAREGHNYFGIWCYRAGCGFTPRQRAEGANHEVRRFESVLDGVRAYTHMLNTQTVYRQLHEARELMRSNGESPTGLALANGLGRYSARREAYVAEIKSLIRQNRLQRYTMDRVPHGGS